MISLQKNDIATFWKANDKGEWICLAVYYHGRCQKFFRAVASAGVGMVYWAIALFIGLMIFPQLLTFCADSHPAVAYGLCCIAAWFSISKWTRYGIRLQ